MKPRSGAASAALVISILALVVSLSAGAFAAATIGKNLVVSKSIKNGAVTTNKIKPSAVDGSRIKNASITSVDLAPGVGKSVVMATNTETPSTANVGIFMAPSGPFEPGQDTDVGIAPVTMKVADLQVLTLTQGIGQAVEVAIASSPNLGVGATKILKCTIGAGQRKCANSATATIPAGHIFFITVDNGPGGAVGGFMSLSYTVRVP